MRILNRKSTGALTKLSALVAAGSLILVTMGVSSLGIAVAAARQDVERSERVAHARPTASPEPEDEARPYHPRGKRDPFLNPLGAADEVDPVGFDVESLELQGIVQTSGGFTAMVRGADRKTYFVKRGERFFNGTLVEIDGGSLTFRVHNRDRLGARLTTDVVLPLHPDRPTTAPHASGGLEN